MSAGDRDNYSGDLSLTAPTGGVVKGKVYAISNSYVVARETKDAAAAFLAACTGAVWATKVSGTGKSLAVGQKVYYASASASVSPSTTGNVLIGRCLKAAAATDTSALIELLAQPPTAS